AATSESLRRAWAPTPRPWRTCGARSSTRTSRSDPGAGRPPRSAFGTAGASAECRHTRHWSGRAAEGPGGSGAQTLDPAPLRGLQPLRDVVAELADRPVWLVGGVVRDALLRRPVRDLDLALAEGSGDVARRLADRLGGAFVPIGAAHGVARVVLPGSPGTVV